MEFTRHVSEMMEERGISEEQILDTICHADRTELEADVAGNTHYLKVMRFRESATLRKGRALRVIVNPHVKPERAVTAYPDRRARV